MTFNNGVSRRQVLQAGGVGAGFSLAGCLGSLGSDSGTELTFASTFEKGTLENIAIAKLKEKVEAETDGELAINHVPGGAYGGEEEMTQTLSNGGLEGMGAGPLPIAMWAPEVWFHSSPFIMDDFEHLLRVNNSELIQSSYENIRQEHDVRVLGDPLYVGWRSMTSNEPVKTVEDFQGFELRETPIGTWIDSWEEIGVNTTTTPSDEVYSSLESGVAEATTSDANQALSMSLYEVQDYFIEVEYLVGNRNLWMNENSFQNLDETHQELILEKSQEASEETTQQGKEAEQETLDELESNGMEIISDVDREGLREAARPYIEEQFDTNWKGTWEEVKSI
ncbi:TRAP transporter substrate-binding protein [Natronomonas halophila]|uniref:TRAP transporter substrate-binding protein n=1 Tax=Natronomonas halophila TaxID=2747817 RepID=UPI0015B78B03|nr:TRAP transporter substrate-binding protein [Natronomonas halophila]QLD86140.1 TRAP transporter substrate-binding protein [Natronomonas halophila]